MQSAVDGESPTTKLKKIKLKNMEQFLKRKDGESPSPKKKAKTDKVNNIELPSPVSHSINVKTEVSSDEEEILDVETYQSPKLSPTKVLLTKSVTEHFAQKAPRRKKTVEKQDDIVMPTENISMFVEADLTILLNKMSEQLPENDQQMFKLRARKIDWEKIAFKGYSPKLCRDVWYMIQGQLRQNRTLIELLNDAREWASTEWKENLKPKIHPDFPKRPLTTAYLLYFSEAKNHILNINPTLDHTIINKLAKKVFTTIEPEKMEYYEKVAVENKRKYEESVEAFYNYYPDLRKKQMAEKVSVHTKPCTPFMLFAQEQRLRLCEELDKAVVKDALKEEWKSMEAKEKLPYIDMALELQKKCIEDADPDETPKLVLTKEELRIKEQMMGKPQKPPSSGYALFARHMLRKKEINEIPSHMRLKKVGTMWKELPDEEKTEYQRQNALLHKKYKKEYEDYLSKDSDREVLDFYKEQVKKNKQKKTKDTEAEATVLNCSLGQSESVELLNAIIPETWMKMTQKEKNKFLDFIKEIRKCFDKKMQKNMESDDEDGDSDSEEESASIRNGSNQHRNDSEESNGDTEDNSGDSDED